MNRDRPIEELLRWRLAQCEADAPPAPPAASLLELARPWWEHLPERFASLVERLGRIRVAAYGHAMAEPRPARGGHSVPALVVRAAEEEIETAVRVLYLDVRAERLRLRFELDAPIEPPEHAFEVTFVPEATAAAPFSAPAVLAVDREYRLETELPEEIAAHWKGLKVTHRIPYRLILRARDAGD